MKSNKSTKETTIIFILVLVIAFAFAFIGWYVGYYRLSPFRSDAASLSLSDVVSTHNAISDRYYGEYDEQKVLKSAITGMIGALNDPYSYYLSTEEYQAILKQDEGEYVGIGLIYIFRNGTIEILDVMPDMPASRAGIMLGETIIRIDGIDVATFGNATEVAAAFSGKEGESMVLSIQTDSGIRDMTLTRVKIMLPPVTLQMLNDDTAYIKLYSFTNLTSEEFPEIAEQIRESNASKLIIDLRSNMGGFSKSALFLTDQFLTSGIISTDQYSNGDTVVNEATPDVAFDPSIKIIVLVSPATASAAETFTAALQENGRATIIGQQTKGKGSINNFFELADGSAVYLTIGEWLTSKGVSIAGTGVTPDIIVEDQIVNGEDAMVKRALEI